MIRIEDIKMVLYDFDDTLCIHKFHESTPDDEHLYNVDVLLKGRKTWDNCRPNKHMKKFMDLCNGHSIRQGLISTSSSYKHFVAKND